MSIIKKAFARFLVSKVSGYIAIAAATGILVLGGFVTAGVYHYKELQRKAAYCEGRLSAMDIVESLQERAVDVVEQNKDEAIEQIEDIRDAEPEVKEIDGEEIVVDGCAAQRAPDAVLDFHRRNRGLRQ